MLDVPQRTAPPGDRDPYWWEAYANCRFGGVDTDSFFPEPGESAVAQRKICAGCSVRDACLADALALRDVHGIRGGMTGWERDHLLAVMDEAARLVAA